jgi:hypothetical protein
MYLKYLLLRLHLMNLMYLKPEVPDTCYLTCNLLYLKNLKFLMFLKYLKCSVCT